MRLLILVVTFLIFSFDAYSSTWVEINKIETLNGGDEKIISLSFSWPFENGDSKIDECKSGCIIGVFYSGGMLYNLDSSKIITIKQSDNCFDMKCLWNKWVEKIGVGILTDNMLTAQPGAANGCWAFLAFPYSPGNITSGPGTPLPGSTCSYPPPETVYCTLDNIPDFEHGALTNKNINGSSVTQQTILKCNATAKVDIYMAYGESIDLGVKDSGLSSQIYIEDNLVTTSTPVTINSMSGETTLKIESRLKTSDLIEGGEYSGSGVLILDVK